MKLHKKNQIQVLDCGCERCTACEGNGGHWQERHGGQREFINCENCKGDPFLKFCREHAIREGWIEEKKKK